MKNASVILLLIISSLVSGQNKTDNIARFFNGNKGCLVILNKNSGKYIRYNAARCRERFSPASTFKIPNSLIGLETGVIPDENFVIKWDGVTREIKEWNRDHTLASAVEFSVVPYFQELARRVGRKKYEEYLQKMEYGNKTIGEKEDYFWLDNSLKISAEEQVNFLTKFYGYNLPFSKRSIDIVKKILPEEEYGNAKMKFKTGTNIKKDGSAIGWLVGYVEKEKDLYFFAFNVDAPSYNTAKKIRDEIPRNILKHLKILE